MEQYENKGFVYIVHLDQKFHHAQHYIGWTKHCPSKRVDNHLAGRGSTFLKAVNLNSISFQISRVWFNVDKNYERKLKKRKNSKFLCPICSPKGKQAMDVFNARWE